MDELGAPEVDDGEIDKQLLKELREFMRQKMAMDARGRYGKPMPPVGGAADALEGSPEEEAGETPEEEDAEIPGVEAVPKEGGAAPGGMDLEKMKAALAGMKRG